MASSSHAFLLDRIVTPIGTMLVVSDREQRVRALDWDDFEERMLRLLRIHYGEVEVRAGSAPADVRSALDAYLAGELGALDRVRVETAGTPFQRAVWKALREIPPGRAESYGELARRIGRASAVRAVGHANGANPIGVIVPCHRVIGKNGSLTGYAGGLTRKRWLLRHEGVALDDGPGDA